MAQKQGPPLGGLNPVACWRSTGPTSGSKRRWSIKPDRPNLFNRQDLRRDPRSLVLASLGIRLKTLALQLSPLLPPSLTAMAKRLHVPDRKTVLHTREILPVTGASPSPPPTTPPPPAMSSVENFQLPAQPRLLSAALSPATDGTEYSTHPPPVTALTQPRCPPPKPPPPPPPLPSPARYQVGIQWAIGPPCGPSPVNAVLLRRTSWSSFVPDDI
jgi:hypothetical protein